jgi:hypothetical protein
MSPDHEDNALEQALRDDLPSPETSARVRRRLLAAGLAVGGGTAVTSAAAAGLAPGVAAGIMGKGLALSWGVKLGALAVVAIPTVGLLVDSNAEPQLAAPPKPAAALASPARSPERAAVTQTAPVPAGESSPERESREVRRQATPAARAGTAEPSSTPEPARPSQVEFATAEAAAAAKAASTLKEETRLLDQAFAELAGGNAARAALLIAEHERRFPAGLLQRERQRAQARLTEISRGE